MYTEENLKQFAGTISEVYLEGVFKRLQNMSDEELNKISVFRLSKEQHSFVCAFGYQWVTRGKRNFYSLGIEVFAIEIKTEA